jgi:hypothetical protein
MKALATSSLAHLTAFSVAIAAIALPSALSAQTRVIGAHGGTAPALLCMLDHVGNACKIDFAGDAYLAARFWLHWSPNKDFALGDLVSAEYSHTQPQNAYTTKPLAARTADVYYVKYRHQDYTFYIVPPGEDGKILYMLIRSGRPEDEKTEPVGLSRIR